MVLLTAKVSREDRVSQGLSARGRYLLEGERSRGGWQFMILKSEKVESQVLEPRGVQWLRNQCSDKSKTRKLFLVQLLAREESSVYGLREL